MAANRKNKNFFTMDEANHPKSDVDRIFLPKQKGDQGLTSLCEARRE